MDLVGVWWVISEDWCLAGHFRWVWRDISDGFGGTFQIDLVGGFGGNVDGAFYMDFVSARELFSWK